jgi:hypothetical protein
MPDPFDDMMYASRLAQEARNLSSLAYDAAVRCDAGRARRLATRAAATAREARRRIAALPARVRDAYATDDVSIRILDFADWHLSKIEKLLKECAKPASAQGSFKGSQGGLAGQAGLNRIEFAFRLKDGVRCERLCMISVYHIEEDATGRIVDPPSQAYKPTFDPLLGGVAPDSCAVGGYIVDAPETVLASPNGNLVLVPNFSPCMPTSLVAGQTVTARDTPDFLKPGFTAFFETCVVCLDTTPPIVLGTARWSHKNGHSDLDSPPDQPGPSGPFRDALKRWMDTHKKP